MADVGGGSSFSGWSWEENKEFEMALAMIDEDNPDRWEEIVSMIGGKKSVEEVKKHYEALLQDLDIIESGRLDQEFGDAQHVAWTDDDQKLLMQLSISDWLDRLLPRQPDSVFFNPVDHSE